MFAHKSFVFSQKNIAFLNSLAKLLPSHTKLESEVFKNNIKKQYSVVGILLRIL